MAGTWGAGDLNDLRFQVQMAADCDQGIFKDQDLDRNIYKLYHTTCSADVHYMRNRPIWWFSKYENTGFFDVKKMYQSYRIINDKNPSGGLKSASRALNLKLPDNRSYHNAVSDAYMTALVFHKLVSKFKEIE